jgi:hypothetical protein
MKKNFLYFDTTLLYIKYGAPKQAKHEQNRKINVDPFQNKILFQKNQCRQFQNKILFQNKFLFLFCPPLKYFSSPILLSEQIVRKQTFFFPTL